MSPVSGGASGMDDLMGVFGNGGGDSSAAAPSSAGGFGGMSDSDIMNGFAGMDLSGQSGQGQAQQQPGGKKTNEDLLSLF